MEEVSNQDRLIHVFSLCVCVRCATQNASFCMHTWVLTKFSPTPLIIGVFKVNSLINISLLVIFTSFCSYVVVLPTFWTILSIISTFLCLFVAILSFCGHSESLDSYFGYLLSCIDYHMFHNGQFGFNFGHSTNDLVCFAFLFLLHTSTLNCLGSL